MVDENNKNKEKEGKQLIIYYGEGEGKTSAAIGHAIRASQYGKVAIIQFMKSKKTGEVTSLKRMKNIDFYQFGLETFFTGKNIKEHREEASKAMKKAKKLFNNNYSLIILDEILNAIERGLVKGERVSELLEKGNCHVILTGRKVNKKIKEKATIITNMKNEKHHYENDKKTIEGIDY